MKRFTTNNFSRAILSDLDSLQWQITNMKEDDGGRKTVQFRWSWNKYNGTGEISHIDGRVCNTMGDNFSYLSISSECRNENPSIKGSCSLYNDKDLELVFDYILEKQSLTLVD